jgi:hypothetical protein
MSKTQLKCPLCGKPNSALVHGIHIPACNCLSSNKNKSSELTIELVDSLVQELEQTKKMLLEMSSYAMKLQRQLDDLKTKYKEE